LSLLDQAIAHGGGKVGAADVTEMLGTLGADLIWPLLDRIAAGDGKGTIEEAERIASRSVALDTALEDLAAILHRVALAQAGAQPQDEEDSARIAAMAQRLDPARVQVMYQVAILGRRDLALAPDEFAGFTMALLRMLSFSDASSRRVTASTPASSPTPQASRLAPSASSLPPPASSPAPASFDGNWSAFVERTGLTGMAGMAARYAELGSYQNNHLELVVPESHRMYAEKAYVDKLKSEIAPHFGAGFRLSVRVGSTAGTSVSAVKSREMEKRQASAAQALEEDPFVKDLVRDLGAEVVPSSIRPADAPGGNPTSDTR
jgi:DNA polymerase III subunit gamma/tau